MAKICIDPGHGGADSGGSGLGRKEKTDVLNISLKIKDLLEAQGIVVVMTRTADNDITIANRAALANKEKCDYFLSIHRDAFSDPTANGSSMYIYSKASADTEKKAQNIYDAVITASGWKRRGLKKGAANYTDFGVNRETSMPSALLELGFVTNIDDNTIFDSKNDAIAGAIAISLCSAVGVLYTVAAPETPVAPVVPAPETPVAPVVPTNPVSNVYKPSVKEWQIAAMADGFKFPKYGADGKWGSECESVASQANCFQRTIHKNKNLTKIVQRVVGVDVDGKFGSLTKAAVINYQKANGLAADGIVGTQTYKKMLGI